MDLFPHLIIKQLLSYDELSNLDKICFVLTCRSLYNARDKYLRLESNSRMFKKHNIHHSQRTLPMYQSRIGHVVDYFANTNNKSFKLNSFRSAIVKSLTQEAEYGADVDQHAASIYSLMTNGCERKIAPTVNHLDFSFFKGDFNKLDEKAMQCKATHIIFGCDLALPRDLSRFGHITHLFLVHNFNHPVLAGDIPNTVTSLKFGNNFNHVLTPGVLPKSIRRLSFGYQYNQPLARGTIPDRLECLSFSDLFNQPIEVGVLPITLVDLSFGSTFDQSLAPRSLPPNLKHLILSERFSGLGVGTLPSSLLSLKMNLIQGQLLLPDYLPAHMTSLTLTVGHNSWNGRLEPGVLPASLTYLALWNFQEQLVKGVLPPNLKIFKATGYNVNCCCREVGTIPDSVEEIDLASNSFIGLPLVPGYLPPRLRSLKMTGHVPTSIPAHFFPSTLQSIEFPSGYNHALPPNALPPSATYLKLSVSFDIMMSQCLVNLAKGCTLVIESSEQTNRFTIPFRERLDRFLSNEAIHLANNSINVIVFNRSLEFTIRFINQSHCLVLCDILHGGIIPVDQLTDKTFILKYISPTYDSFDKVLVSSLA
ncbi:hypothetical protein SAMD00019534_104870 [Acytostelium subglobosum LB1]|uniref:hypothetical protein n=1 Tax=Acytostelium subglobosum LB1 TaxID=1410327 RepID=UPI000644D6B0|nr:hypothetical protein SAMD00019534_104870 [Acytostelium subglobosum LB1]GAM27312.1 hypothetical protein SAMD00019534_104870 [Acytostelium subglobosum LB1]|eukprot:XP_012749779.1 hypothetical protein SAMD00019534_104870 [Acytostelium subglobosum LB1]